MTTRLAQLRRRLIRLRHRRRNARLTIAYSALLTSIAWILSAIFLADWAMRMGRPERAVLIVIGIGVLFWAWRRFTGPWLGKSEDDLDMALLVERQQRIDTDLIAALEFESPEAPRWGSIQLEQAVIEQVAQTSSRIEPETEVPKTPLNRRAVVLVVTAVVLGALIWQYPQYAAVFFNRLLLGAKHYPTDTSIESVTINNQKVDLAWADQTVHCPYRQHLAIEVQGTGVLPEQGEVRLKASKGRAAAVDLKPIEPGSGVYRGESEPMAESVDLLLYLGDAYTEPVRIEITPLPKAELEIEVAPPAYTQGKPEVFTDLRMISAIEGSQIHLAIHADKPLDVATLSILDAPPAVADASGETQPSAPTAKWKKFPMVKAEKQDSNGRETWVLNQGDSPLASLREQVEFRIDVIDKDKLEMERPIEGLIKLRTDDPPQVIAWKRANNVVKLRPTARPTIHYQTSDDFGVARVSIVPTVIHADGTKEARPAQVIFEAPATAPKDKTEAYRFPLAGLGLRKGDQLELVVEAVDNRGSADRGKTASEALVYNIADDREIEESLTEQDRESERQFDTMIPEQTEVGEAK